MSSTVETTSELRPFQVDIPEEELAELRRRAEVARRGVPFGQGSATTLAVFVTGLIDGPAAAAMPASLAAWCAACWADFRSRRANPPHVNGEED